ADTSHEQLCLFERGQGFRARSPASGFGEMRHRIGMHERHEVERDDEEHCQDQTGRGLEMSFDPLQWRFHDARIRIWACMLAEASLPRKLPLIGAARCGVKPAATATWRSATANPCVGS